MKVKCESTIGVREDSVVVHSVRVLRMTGRGQPSDQPIPASVPVKNCVLTETILKNKLWPSFLHRSSNRIYFGVEGEGA